MPPDVDYFLATGNLSVLVQRFQPGGIPPVMTVAVGSSGSSTACSIALLNSMIGEDEPEGIELLSKSLEPVKHQKIAPLYLNATVALYSDLIWIQAVQAVENITGSCEYAEPYQEGDFLGVKVDLASLMGEIEVDEDDAASQQQKADLVQAFQGRSGYLLFKRLNDTIITVLCEDPADVKLPGSPAESLLATDKLAQADVGIGGSKNPCLFLYVPSALAESYVKLSLKRVNTICEQIKQQGEQLATQAQGEDKDAIIQGLQGLDVLRNAYIQTLPETVSLPITLMSWTEGKGVHAVLTTDAGPGHYTSGIRKLGTLAEQPDTALYIEGQSVIYDNGPDTPQILKAGGQVALAAAVLSKNDPETFDGMDWDPALVRQFIPLLEKLGNNLNELQSGIGNSSAFVIKAQDNPMVPAAVAAYAPVTDRAKLTAGWKQTLETVGEGISLLGGNPDTLSMLPITETAVSGGTGYTIALPFNEAGLAPNLLLSDTSLVLASSPEMSQTIVASATGTEPLEGTKLTFRPAPAAQIARAIAERIKREETSEIQENGNLDEETPADNAPDNGELESAETDGGDIDEEDPYEDDLEATVPEMSEDAQQTEKIADDLESLAEIVERVDVSGTVKDNVSTVTIDVTLTDQAL